MSDSTFTFSGPLHGTPIRFTKDDNRPSPWDIVVPAPEVEDGERLASEPTRHAGPSKTPRKSRRAGSAS